MELTKRKSGNVPTFSGLFDEFFSRELQPLGNRLLTKNTPAVNICELEDKFTLEVAAPGLVRDDFHVEVTPDNLLIISSVQQNESERTETGRFTLKEFSRSTFSRSFNLPESVDTDQIQAACHNGILTLTLPKRPEALPKPSRVIQID